MTSLVPKVSVCVPVHNQASYLRSALESVLAQSVQDFEVLVVDDASTDDPHTVVAATGDPRVRYLRQRTNVGVARNRNTCLEAARGVYVSWLDADDRYEPGALEALSETLDENPGVGLVHAGFHLIDEAGERLRGWEPHSQCDLIVPGREGLRELTLCNYITTSTVMVRRQVQEQAGGFLPEVGQSSTDWNMWLRLALHGDVAYRAVAVTEYRQHANTISATTARSGERLRCDSRAVRHVFARYGDSIRDATPLYRKAKAALAIRWLLHGGDCFAEGRTAAAVGAVLQAGLLARPRVGMTDWTRLFVAICRGDEYSHYRSTKGVLRQLYGPLRETSYGQKIEKLALVDPEWERVTGQIATIVQRITGERAQIAAIDKHDPTILHLSRRTGRHFPDLPGATRGMYPRDSQQAIAHLEALRREGIRYLVVPCFAAWWLDFYGEFGRHLELGHRKVWADELCTIYQLERVAQRCELGLQAAVRPPGLRSGGAA